MASTCAPPIALVVLLVLLSIPSSTSTTSSSTSSSTSPIPSDLLTFTTTSSPLTGTSSIVYDHTPVVADTDLDTHLELVSVYGTWAVRVPRPTGGGGAAAGFDAFAGFGGHTLTQRSSVLSWYYRDVNGGMSVAFSAADSSLRDDVVLAGFELGLGVTQQGDPMPITVNDRYNNSRWYLDVIKVHPPPAYTSQTVVPEGASSSWVVRMADLTGDGSADDVVLGKPSGLAVRLSSGDWAWEWGDEQVVVSLAEQYRMLQLLAVDLDGDGRAEVLASFRHSSTGERVLVVVDNAYPLAFDNATTTYELSIYQDLAGVHDFDGDGVAEVLLSVGGTSSDCDMPIWKRASNGTYEVWRALPVPASDFDCAAGAGSIVEVLDFDGDGSAVDVATTSGIVLLAKPDHTNMFRASASAAGFSVRVQLYLRVPSVGMVPAFISNQGTLRYFTGNASSSLIDLSLWVAVATELSDAKIVLDINGDGLDDVCTNDRTTLCALQRAEGPAGFHTEVSVSDHNIENPYSIDVYGRFDESLEHPQIIAEGNEWHDYFLSFPDGSLVNRSIVFSSDPGTERFFAALPDDLYGDEQSLIDLDQDGHLDVFTITTIGSKKQAQIGYGDGRLGFEWHEFAPLDYFDVNDDFDTATVCLRQGFTFADLDGDGDYDLVYTHRYTTTLVENVGFVSRDEFPFAGVAVLLDMSVSNVADMSLTGSLDLVGYATAKPPFQRDDLVIAYNEAPFQYSMQKVSNMLSETTAGCPGAADSDGDGDVDLQINARAIESRWSEYHRPLRMTVRPDGNDTLCTAAPETEACASIEVALQVSRPLAGSYVHLLIHSGTYTPQWNVRFLGFGQRLFIIELEDDGITIDCAAISADSALRESSCVHFVPGDSGAGLRIAGGTIRVINADLAVSAVTVRHVQRNLVFMPPARGITCSGGLVAPCVMPIPSPRQLNGTGSLDAMAVVVESARSASNGGCLSVLDSGHVTLQRFKLVGCYSPSSGGAVFVDNVDDLHLTRSVIDSSTAAQFAGGVFIDNSDQVRLYDTTVRNCSARAGAAVYVGKSPRASSSTVTLRACSIESNSAASECGGVMVDEYGHDVTLRSTTLSRNTAGGRGGALCIRGAGSAVHMVDQSTASGNRAVTAGFALVDKSGTLAASDSSVRNNTAAEASGAVHCEVATVSLTRMDIAENQASSTGGAITAVLCDMSSNATHFTGNVASDQGGAIHATGTALGSKFQGALVVAASNFSGNAAGQGGALYVDQIGSQLSDSLFLGNQAVAQGEASAYDCTLASRVIGGGAVFATEGALLELERVTFESNNALVGNGGAILLDVPPTAIASAEAVVFDGNSAAFGGGAVWFSHDGEVVVPPLVEPGVGEHTNSADGFGAFWATDRLYVRVAEQGATATLQESRKPLRDSLSFEVLDGMQQAMRGDRCSTVDMSVSQTGEPQSSLLLDGSRRLAVDGIVNLTASATQLEAEPGSDVLLVVSADGIGGAPLQVLPSASLTIHMAECPKGTFEEARLRCTSCSAGRFSNTTGLRDECHLCGPGTSQPKSGADVCVQCAPGSFASINGSISCVLCPPGRVTPARGATECVACPPGRYMSESGGTECVDCPAGEFAPSSGNLFCSPCAAGRFQPESNSTTCRECDVGRFQNASGAEACVVCGPGRAQSDDGAIACEPCPPGRASRLIGQSECEPCPENSYATEFGMLQCERCMAPEFAVGEGATECDVCAIEEYALFPANSTFQGCVPCPAGAYCAGGQVVALEQRWLNLNRRTGEFSTFECLPGACVSNGKCAAGRKQADDNPLCAVCEENKYEWNGECVDCARVRGEIIFVLVVVSVLFVVGYHRMAQSVTGELPVALYFVQMVLLFVGPENGFVVYVLEVFNFNIGAATGSSCVMPLSGLDRIWFTLVGPASTFVVLAMMFGCDRLWAEYERRSGSVVAQNCEDDPTAPYKRTLIGLVLFTYNGVMQTVFQFITCKEVEVDSDTRLVVEQYPDVECTSSEYKGALAVMIVIALLELVVFPAIFMWHLWRAKRDGALDSPRVLRVWGILYSVFKPQWWFYQVYATSRRTVHLFVFAWLNDDRPSKLATGSLFNVIFLSVHLWLQPFRVRAENVVETLSLILLTAITIVLPLMDEPYSDAENAVILCMSFLPAMAFLAWAVETKVVRVLGRLGLCDRWRKGLARRAGQERSLTSGNSVMMGEM